MYQRFIQTTYLFIAVVISGCSMQPRTHHSLIQGAKDRGPIAISTENPYLVGNRILDLEMERSAELEGFIQKRGGPAAIEVRRELFSAMELILFYPENNHYYEALETSQGWLIDGPREISPEKRQQLFAIVGAVEVPSQQISAGDEIPHIEPQLQPDPASGIVPAPKSGPISQSSLQNLTAQRVESLILKHQLPDAPTHGRGDITHRVTQYRESAELLAQWYTHDASNGARIARLNQLRADIPLDPNTEIIIPSYLVKVRKHPTAEVMREFAAGGGD